MGRCLAWFLDGICDGMFVIDRNPDDVSLDKAVGAADGVSDSFSLFVVAVGVSVGFCAVVGCSDGGFMGVLNVNWSGCGFDRDFVALAGIMLVGKFVMIGIGRGRRLVRSVYGIPSCVYERWLVWWRDWCVLWYI